ncbi:hypothetical protein Agabi119p4_7348 [Agaricus bisporus var. burnettii]|uniref:Probable RNA polymerase II nuclear localization protein SLC7A6OS n=1 Tax=Agaricus bisporus var. burnettii TaxID=192524 RepID=A0A8H7C816_AGABI|nr:hypothetical protein Agabi119p4_7348 [Agaricus bisporus var. burnettii]
MCADSSPASSQSYTILRIKRKRNEEPLDALVIDSRVRRKKSRGGAGVFQYADTVEDGVWKDVKSQKVIQEKISRLAKGEVVRSPVKSIPSEEPEPPLSPIRTKKPRYTIVPPATREHPIGRQGANPPKVHSSNELQKNPFDFRVYDAILSKQRPLQASAPDPEMEKFIPLLNDYLKIHDIMPSSKPVSTSVAPSAKNTASVSDDESGDYVWDVFYHRPVTLSEWNSVATRTGTLTGLPGSALNSDDSDSDSEEEDEADEDSNAEEYYKNDYPDEETDSEPELSDEFHERSDYDEMICDRDEDF